MFQELRSAPRPGGDSDAAIIAAVGSIADDVAARHAQDVDSKARFPMETVNALKDARALSAFVPVELGGQGASFQAIARNCYLLGRRCGASAMVYAMHQIQVVTLVRHAAGQPFFQAHLRRIADEQRLIASVTSEVGTGGDLGRSIAAVTPAANALTFTKQAPTVSFGAYADDLLTTLRRSPTAEPSDQLIVLTRSDQHSLAPLGEWDPVGMRGTCSPGFEVTAHFGGEQLVDQSFGEIAVQSMIPVSHLLWAHVWLGLASDAFDRARAAVRASAKASPGSVPPAAVKLSHLLCDLELFRAEVKCALADYLDHLADPRWLANLASILRFNNLKIVASEQAVRVCDAAMNVAGISGFMNNSPFGVGRHLRDTMSARLMVSNDRIHAANAALLLVAKDV
jgi:acyl-CoA dehydrogenase